MLDTSRKTGLLGKLSMCMSPMPPMGSLDKGDYMSAQNARRLQAHSNKLAAMVMQGVDLPDWAEQKLTLAADYVQSICNHLSYGEKRPHMPSARRIILIKRMGL